MLRLQTPLPDRYTAAIRGRAGRHDRRRQGRPSGPGCSSSGTTTSATRSWRWADARGDSFGLSRIAADQTEAEFIVFCGVHFMAESADILTGDHQQVVLPDLNAGCSMADMADIDRSRRRGTTLARVTDIDRVIPVTYMNSSAALKAFVGRHGGAVCTSSNARAVLTWALARGAGGAGATRSCSSPTSTWAATPASSSATAPTTWRSGTRGWPRAASTTATLKSVHPACCGRGTARSTSGSGPSTSTPSGPSTPAGSWWSTPSAPTTSSRLADQVGSTDSIIRAVADAPAGSVIGVGTEIHLVKRLDDETPDKTVVSLDPLVCPCSTMFRIDAAHLAWVLEGLVEGEVRNRIIVDAGDGRVGPGGARADARHHLSLPPGPRAVPCAPVRR